MKLNELCEAKAPSRNTTYDKVAEYLRVHFPREQSSINDDLTVDMEGNLEITDLQSQYLPLEFSHVTGNFNLARNEHLITLDGSPTIVSKDFDLYDCAELTSLEHGPEMVGGSIYLELCPKIKTLEHCPSFKEEGTGNLSLKSMTGLESLYDSPEHVKNVTIVSCWKLKNLEGLPKTIEDDLTINNCAGLTSLKGAPGNVLGNLTVMECPKLESLEGGPSRILGNLFLIKSVKSLVGVHEHIDSIGGNLTIDEETIMTGGLGLLMVKNLKDILPYNRSGGMVPDSPFGIIRKYLRKPNSIFECQQELIEAGYEAWAEL